MAIDFDKVNLLDLDLRTLTKEELEELIANRFEMAQYYQSLKDWTSMQTAIQLIVSYLIEIRIPEKDRNKFNTTNKMFKCCDNEGEPKECKGYSPDEKFFRCFWARPISGSQLSLCYNQLTY
jgi:hypothetical protein